ncbi:cysteine desulfurase-like protein [Leptolyngbya sp. FACHB-711]|uniref:cysteine desulfurase-like protein n=1 Tax=unclassified Leptolyngbya TaxID=2650499 RepID=UPI001682CCE1|nr:cysteine desulfurase-like protein [Leptolyngbya sp. FACHB-711]MBD1850850.1 cysteine desulfurase-like protein [Cyanobacteria bacterium FACHB-502]MBD2023978.1 cysteine desulfurase-like protein [Leptolyngbya sp. FACHB-711]
MPLLFLSTVIDSFTVSQPAIDLGWVRAQFPALAQTVNGEPAVFFDGPGGTQVSQRVIQAMTHYLTFANANTHGVFLTSQRTDRTIESAHAAMADFLHCAPQEVVFGANMTTLTFALSRSIARELKPGDEIVVTRLDHDANVSPWTALAEIGVTIRWVDFHPEDCTLDYEDLQRQITEKTKLVAIGYASNAVGTISDVAKAVELAHQVGAWVYIDAVHYAPHGSIDVKALDCDFLACSPYKFFAPHAGVLYGKAELLNRLYPYKVRPAANTSPDRWETGTQNHEAMAGVTAAIEYLADLGRKVDPQSADRRAALVAAMNAIQQYEADLAKYLIAELLQIPGLQFYGITDFDRIQWRTPTVSIRLKGYHPKQVAQALSDRGIFTWSGNYYALNLSERLGVEDQGGMVRIGLAHYNTTEEIDRMLEVLHQLAKSESP